MQNNTKELETQLNELQLILTNNKEYLFILESNISKKNNQIQTLQNELQKQKKENDILKSSNSWKITQPFRNISNKLK